MSAWPKVRLGEVLTQFREYVAVPDAREYRKLSVKLYGKGVTLDAPVRGELLKMQRHQIATAGQLIVSEIWGKKGAIGFVPKLGDGALCTSHFFLFDVNRTRLDPDWLQAILTRNLLGEELDALARGTTGYAAVRPQHFLSLAIPLPLLPEQQRIVARIDQIAAHVTEAKELQADTTVETETLAFAAADRVFRELAQRVLPTSFAALQPHVTSGPRNWGKNYERSGLRFYRAQDINRQGDIVVDPKVFVNPPDGEQGRSAMPKPGDLLLVITGATVGRVACFGSEHELGFVSQHVAICRLPPGKVLPRFAWWGLRSPSGQEQLAGQQYGQGKPGLNLTNIRTLALPLPNMEEQHRVVAKLDALQAEVDALKQAQA